MLEVPSVACKIQLPESLLVLYKFLNFDFAGLYDPITLQAVAVWEGRAAWNVLATLAGSLEGSVVHGCGLPMKAVKAKMQWPQAKPGINEKIVLLQS
jgi:hypothetical protein